MYLQTSLCNTVLDNPHNYTKIDLVNHIVNSLEMDTILFHSSVRKCLYKSSCLFFPYNNDISIIIFL